MNRLLNQIFMLIIAMIAIQGISSEAKAANSAQINVESLKELKPYLKKDNVNVKLKEGTYSVTPADIKKGKFMDHIDVVQGRDTYAILMFSGNNSTYDFSGVTIEVETKVFNAYQVPIDDFYEVHILGNNNVVKGLTLIDVGNLLDFPKKGACNIVMDGSHNRIEDFVVRSRGSIPYGYGELFGKGGKNVTIRHRKHSACLIRGESNHLKDSKFYHQAYGHCIFMQAANNPLIEGCYVEAEITTTDKVLEEQGTGSAADKIDFKTTWGYRVPAGHVISKAEAGIRAYNAGNTMIDGKRYSRGTSNVTVKNCYIKDARVGVTLTHTKGKVYVEGCTAVGCSRAYAVNRGGKIVDCKADVKYGPAFGVDYESDSGIEADITLIPYEGESYNGTTHAAIIIGSNHKITFRSAPGLKADQNLIINIGGDNKTIGKLDKDDNYKAANIVIDNQSAYPIVLDDNSSNITVTTLGSIEDYGTDNKITKAN